MAEASGTKWWICHSINVLAKNEKCLLFYSKTKGSFWPIQYVVSVSLIHMCLGMFLLGFDFMGLSALPECW